jgi:high-affinity nickel permease
MAASPSKSITASHAWQHYFVGMVFGIGFDTATEVLLLAATAYAAIQGLPYYAVLALPFLFSGGLMLIDSVDGCLHRSAVRPGLGGGVDLLAIREG